MAEGEKPAAESPTSGGDPASAEPVEAGTTETQVKAELPIVAEVVPDARGITPDLVAGIFTEPGFSRGAVAAVLLQERGGTIRSKDAEIASLKAENQSLRDDREEARIRITQLEGARPMGIAGTVIFGVGTAMVTMGAPVAYWGAGFVVLGATMTFYAGWLVDLWGSKK